MRARSASRSSHPRIDRECTNAAPSIRVFVNHSWTVHPKLSASRDWNNPSPYRADSSMRARSHSFITFQRVDCKDRY